MREATASQPVGLQGTHREGVGGAGPSVLIFCCCCCWWLLVQDRQRDERLLPLRHLLPRRVWLAGPSAPPCRAATLSIYV